MRVFVAKHGVIMSHWGSVGVIGRSVGLNGAQWGSVRLIGGSVGVIGAHWGSVGVSGAQWGSVRNVYTPIFFRTVKSTLAGSMKLPEISLTWFL